MKKLYTLICLASILLFFYAPVNVVYDVIFDEKIEQTDTSNQDNQNRLPNPLEEEVLHPSICVENPSDTIHETKNEFKKYTFNWKAVDLENTTPPPEHPIFFV